MLYVRELPSWSLQMGAVEPSTSSFVVRVTFEHTGAWLMTATLMSNVCVALVSTPPLAVPPLSWMRRVIWANPVCPAATVKVSVPSALTAGCVEKRPVLVLPVTSKVRIWPDSLAGPLLMAVAQPDDGVGPGVLVHELAGALGERRDVVDRGDVDSEGLDVTGVVPAVEDAAIVMDAHVYRGTAVGVGSQGVGRGCHRH